MSTSSSPTRIDPYAAWRIPDYRLFGIGWFFLMFAAQMETVAIGIHIYHRTHEALSLGFIGLAKALPVMLLSIAGGHLADRFNRKRILLSMMWLGSLSTVALTLAIYFHAPLGVLYLLLSLTATSQALGGPSRAAIMPLLVPQAIFSNAVTWNANLFQVASMTGPAVAGILIGTTMVTTAGADAGDSSSQVVLTFAIASIGRLISIFTVTGVRPRQQAMHTEPATLRTVLAGVEFIWKTKQILAAITLDLFAVLFGGLTYLLPIFADDILHVGSTGLGFLRAAEAVGAVVMGVLLTHLPPMKRPGRLLLYAVCGFGIATILFGVSRFYWFSLAMMFAIGALDNISVVIRHSLVQMLTPDGMRGRVSAVNNIFIVASNDLGGLESGLSAWLFSLLAITYLLDPQAADLHTQAQVYGAITSVVVGGVCVLVVVAATAKWLPQVRSIASLDDLRPEK